MANKFKGEKTIELAGIEYNMVVDMGVISEFMSETGSDFMHVTVKAIDAMIKTRSIENAFERAIIMTKAVSLNDAAWLFYLAANKGNSKVEFEEIQEALILEGALDGIKISYPLQFASLVNFAVAGSIKKKK